MYVHTFVAAVDLLSTTFHVMMALCLWHHLPTCRVPDDCPRLLINREKVGEKKASDLYWQCERVHVFHDRL